MRNEAAAVLAFWFGELAPEQQFAKDDRVDATIAERFGGLRARLAASGADNWLDHPQEALAAVIVLDQFSRNLHRGAGEAYAADPLALDLALAAIARGHHRALAPEQQAFLYMPLMHAEDRGIARFSVRCFADLGRAENLAFAHEHAEVIDRFGRYPTRNAALGRTSTAAEEAYLRQPGVGW